MLKDNIVRLISMFGAPDLKSNIGELKKPRTADLMTKTQFIKMLKQLDEQIHYSDTIREHLIVRDCIFVLEPAIKKGGLLYANILFNLTFSRNRHMIKDSLYLNDEVANYFAKHTSDELFLALMDLSKYREQNITYLNEFKEQFCNYMQIEPLRLLRIESMYEAHEFKMVNVAYKSKNSQFINKWIEHRLKSYDNKLLHQHKREGSEQIEFIELLKYAIKDFRAEDNFINLMSDQDNQINLNINAYELSEVVQYAAEIPMSHMAWPGEIWKRLILLHKLVGFKDNESELACYRAGIVNTFKVGLSVIAYDKTIYSDENIKNFLRGVCSSLYPIAIKIGMDIVGDFVGLFKGNSYAVFSNWLDILNEGASLYDNVYPTLDVICSTIESVNSLDPNRVFDIISLRSWDQEQVTIALDNRIKNVQKAYSPAIKCGIKINVVRLLFQLKIIKQLILNLELGSSIKYLEYFYGFLKFHQNDLVAKELKSLFKMFVDNASVEMALSIYNNASAIAVLYKDKSAQQKIEKLSLYILHKYTRVMQGKPIGFPSELSLSIFEKIYLSDKPIIQKFDSIKKAYYFILNKPVSREQSSYLYKASL